MPPLARLAQLADFLHDDDLPELVRIFQLADIFMERFNDPDFRREVSLVEHPRAPGGNTTFVEARSLTEELQVVLERLFQSTRPLKAEAAHRVDGCKDDFCLGHLTGRYMLL